MPEHTKNLSEAALEKVADRFKALSEPTRLTLLYSLMDGEKTVTQLVEETGASQANVSKHLGMLFDAGILGRRKQGTSAFYRITDESVFELCDVVCGSIHDRLAAELDGFAALRRESP
ncbi:MAG TPA: metalloregulator ArsR/SmtB family transcription factor [Rubrobacteraceae bacterium]|nr:metalloregulator ArsR/SmtB family transcription factor [Rubrobacteraceae bacterium]